MTTEKHLRLLVNLSGALAGPGKRDYVVHTTAARAQENLVYTASANLVGGGSNLYLAASKLRTCAIGPELVLHPDYGDVRGEVAIERGVAVVWSKAIRSGLDIHSGLHTLLGDDPELAEAARSSGVRIVDYRRAPERYETAIGRRHAMSPGVWSLDGDGHSPTAGSALWSTAPRTHVQVGPVGRRGR